MGDWEHPKHYTQRAKEYSVITRTSEIAIFIDRALPNIREEARKCGYAIAVHGSCARDLDLVAIPWTEEAVDYVTLIDVVCDAINQETGWGMNSDRKRSPTVKPHGRMAITIVASMEVQVDLSIMPRKIED